MEDKSTPFQTGAGGSNFEQSVQTAFLVSLLIQGEVPGIPTSKTTEISFQNKSRGYDTDDLLIKCESSIGTHKVLAQIKSDLTFSSSNKRFLEVMEALWSDFSNTLFDKKTDKLWIVKSGLTIKERTQIKTVLNWAKTHSTETHFFEQVNRYDNKKEVISIFRESLIATTKVTKVLDSDLWQFLKVLDLLEFDFTNDASIDHAHLCNLINLVKGDGVDESAEAIIGDMALFIAKHNKDGGSVTNNSILKTHLVKYFESKKVSNAFQQLEKIKKRGSSILEPLKNDVSGFTLDRTDIDNEIVNGLARNQITIITGKPGYGKSAAVRDYLNREDLVESTFVFKADQFNEPLLSSVFPDLHFAELISLLSLSRDKVIFIDSLEKLLEGDPENAFKQFLVLIEKLPDIKLIATARRYAVELLIQKFGIEKSQVSLIEVPALDTTELELLSSKFPVLDGLRRNQGFKSITESPKYLDFILKALSKEGIDFDKASIKDLKSKLWDLLICNATSGIPGLGARREHAFVNLSVNRAKAMRLFVECSNLDKEALDLLENEEIIVRDGNKRRYAPAHDILEDWALVNHVTAKHDEFTEPEVFISQLGAEPAIRRGFRLWVEEQIIEDIENVHPLIESSLNSQIPSYWADEVLISIFRSDDCSKFFIEFNSELLSNNAQLLNRCIHLIRTACKESDLDGRLSNTLLPIGSGWKHLIHFISNNIIDLDSLRLSIVNLLYNWQIKSLFSTNPPKDECNDVVTIAVHYLNQMEAKDEFWHLDKLKDERRKVIALGLYLSSFRPDTIAEIIKRAIPYATKNKYGKLARFYDQVLDCCLEGLDSEGPSYQFPELIIEAAWKSWKLKEREEPASGSLHSLMYKSRLTGEECWGIEDKFGFFPSGVYKTPLIYLLKYQAVDALKFVVEFVNYSVDHYHGSDCEYKHKMSSKEIVLNDGTKIQQWGCYELWAAYRGLSVTHYCLESLLMGLEKHMLGLANVKTEISKKNIKFMFNYIYRNSNNVTFLGVLSSVTMAYPEEVGEEMLPLLRNKEFYEWDLHRAIQESSALAPLDNELAFAQEIRSKSNQLPHRRKYFRGLRDFVFDYQLNIGLFNSEIHKVFDSLKSGMDSKDTIWSKALSEMDMRSYKLGEYDQTLGGFRIEAEYEPSVKEFLEENQEGFELEDANLKISGDLWKSFNEESEMTLDTWKQYYEWYKSKEFFDIMYDRHVTLAHIGLKEFSKELEEEEINWCLETLVKSIYEIVKERYPHSLDINPNLNIMEKDISLSSFGLIYQHLEGDEDKEEFAILIFYSLISSSSRHEAFKIPNHLRDTVFTSDVEICKKVWWTLIQYAKFDVYNPYFRDDSDREKINSILVKKDKFIRDTLAIKSNEIDFEKIDLKSYEGQYLMLAASIVPFDSKDTTYDHFNEKLLKLVIEDFKKDDEVPYHRRRKGRQLDFHQTELYHKYLTTTLLNSDLKKSSKVIDLILNSITEASKVDALIGRDLVEYFKRVFNDLINNLNTSFGMESEERYQLLIQRFWDVWHYLVDKIGQLEKPMFMKAIFMDMYWSHGAENWITLEGRKNDYKKMVEIFGSGNSDHLLNVLSTIGSKELLPEGLNWLVNILKSDPPQQRLILRGQFGALLIKRLFQNNILTIKNNNQLISDFLWLLDVMIELGSSEAYFYRENTIKYRTT